MSKPYAPLIIACYRVSCIPCTIVYVLTVVGLVLPECLEMELVLDVVLIVSAVPPPAASEEYDVQRLLLV